MPTKPRQKTNGLEPKVNGLRLQSFSSACRLALPPLLLGALLVALIICYYIYRLTSLDYAGGTVENEISGIRTSPHSVTTNAKTSVNLNFPYEHGRYFELSPSKLLVNETVLNPQLALFYGVTTPLTSLLERLGDLAQDASLPALERSRTARVVAAVRDIPSVRRYILSDMVAGRRYMLRLSYLGSPSASYHFYLYHIRRSALQAAAARASGGDGTAAAPAVDEGKIPRGLRAFVPMDTEMITFSIHDRYASLFAENEAIIYDGADLQRRAEEEEAARKGGDAAPRKRNDDPFVAVVEVRPSVHSLAADPRDFAVLSYNLYLERLTLNIVPGIAFPLAICCSLVCLVLGRVVLYRWIRDAIIVSVEEGVGSDDGYAKASRVNGR